MSYLLTQMLLALVLAAITGAALGWLMHRRTGLRRESALRELIGEQDRRLNQANGELSMLEDDYRELRERTQAEIESLKQDNRQLPVLSQNLEKSQLLVRQMMQKHEAQLRDLNTEIRTLRERLTKAREERAEQSDLSHNPVPALTTPATDTATGSTETSDLFEVDGDIDGGTDVPLPTARLGSAARLDTSSNSLDTIDPSPEAAAGSTTSPASSESADGEETMDEVIAVDPALQSEIRNSTPSGAQQDETGEEDPLFERVDRHDDLKQIYGIGPVTEQSLNELGITSYNQLAELEQHDIETIARALGMYPDRIENDDWVGSARRQLEAVLEEL